MLDIAYGHKVESDNDPYLGYIEMLGRAVAGAGVPGVSAVDLFPFCRYREPETIYRLTLMSTSSAVPAFMVSVATSSSTL